MEAESASCSTDERSPMWCPHCECMVSYRIYCDSVYDQLNNDPTILVRRMRRPFLSIDFECDPTCRTHIFHLIFDNTNKDSIRYMVYGGLLSDFEEIQSGSIKIQPFQPHVPIKQPAHSVEIPYPMEKFNQHRKKTAKIGHKNQVSIRTDHWHMWFPLQFHTFPLVLIRTWVLLESIFLTYVIVTNFRRRPSFLLLCCYIGKINCRLCITGFSWLIMHVLCDLCMLSLFFR